MDHNGDSQKIETQSDNATLINHVLEQIQKRAENRDHVTGVPTGYYTFDEYTAGFQPSNLIIVAGRPSMGKTALALNVAMRAACGYDVPTAVFSLEMSKEQIMMRMLCAWGKVDISKIRRGRLDDDDWARLIGAAGQLSPAPICVDDTTALTVVEILERCRRLKAERGLGLVVVDCLQLLRPAHKAQSREQGISDISRYLKALAQELAVPVLVVSQLERKVGERADKRPTLSDLPGALERDADVIVFLYRKATYKREDELNPNDNVAEIIIGKQRNGPTGTVKLRFFKESASFENLGDIPAPSE